MKYKHAVIYGGKLYKAGAEVPVKRGKKTADKATEPAKTTETAKATEPAKATETAKATEPAKATETAKATEPAKATASAAIETKIIKKETAKAEESTQGA